MKFHPLVFIVSLLVFAALDSSAVVRYVNVNSATPAPPYISWSTAATVIQDAIDAASPGDQILVTNGVYETGGRVVLPFLLTNRVVVDKSVTVQSVNGPGITVIKGYKVPGGDRDGTGTRAVRCVYLTNNATLSGFTLTNGSSLSEYWDQTGTGGGIYSESPSSVVTNCVITGNSAYQIGGGASGGTLLNCTIATNTCLQGGGACRCSLDGCLILGNQVGLAGGGIYQSTANKCIITGNMTGGGYAFGGGATSSTLNQCILNDNVSDRGGGANSSYLFNCVIVNNSAYSMGGGTYNSALWNCIVYYNLPDNGVGGFDHCCVYPLYDGVGNFTNAPLFMDFANGNFHLQSNSPCINAGHNATFSASKDLDGNPRIVGGTIDVGAYEFQSPASIISYAWLQQYGLPIDGSADYTDTDLDLHNTWQEWRAGTVPSDALSVLKMLTPSNAVSGVTVSWQSVSGKNYFLQRSVDLNAQPPFLTLISNIVGQVGFTSYTDTNSAAADASVYRVGVQ